MPTESQVTPEDMERLTELRSMWEFASLMQFIFLFGHVVKIDDDFDIEVPKSPRLRFMPEMEKLRIMKLDADTALMTGPRSRMLEAYTFREAGEYRAGTTQICIVTSRFNVPPPSPISRACSRANTHYSPEIFDEYTRRQYIAKAPSRNPFGEAEDPIKFNDMDVRTRIQILQQLSIWTFGNAERIRGMMSQDEDHLGWRIEPLGWDKDDRAYFVLDDNRLYRRSDEPVPPPTPVVKPKAKSKSKKGGRSKTTRSSKRRKVEETSDEEPEAEAVAMDVEAGAQDDTMMTNGEHAQPEDEPGYGFTSKTWECIAITLEEYNDFLASIFRSRDPNEMLLRKRIEDDVLPIIEKRAEALRQKQLKKLRELENLQKMATAKRSSRLASKAEKDQEEREKREAEEKRHRDLKMAHEEEDRQRRIEEGHESRRLTREQRLKEREVKRILHEEELQKLQEQEERAISQDPTTEAAASDDSKRISARQTKTQKEQHKKQLEELAEEDGKWYFDCSVCGLNGENLDDGTHSVACDRCGVWQHSKCYGFSPKQAEKEGFTFVCNSCKKKKADENKPKIPPLKLGKKAASGSPETQRSASRPPSAVADGSRDSGLPAHVQRQLDGVYIPTGQPRPSPGPFGQITNGPSLSPHGQAQGPPGYRYPPVGNFAHHQPQQAWHGSPLPPPNRPPSSGFASSPPPTMANGYAPPPHHQQHQYAHQGAVVSSGGHPAYQPPQYQQHPQANGYSPRAPNSQYPMSQPPQAHYPPPNSYLQHQHQRPPPPQQQQRPSSGHHAPPRFNQHPQQPPHRPSDAPLMNGFQSPVKGAAQPASSPPQQAYAQPSNGSMQPSPSLQQSPKTSFPPPTNNFAQQQSPVKSSPPHHTQQQYQRPHQSSPALNQTPGNLRPPSANGYQPPAFQTPQAQMQPQSAMANGVVADGMAGPWPEGSKSIPQKHDQSPVPPSSAQTVGETKVMPPPFGALTPSPSQQALGQPGNIPIKKTVPETNGVAASQQQPQQ